MKKNIFSFLLAVSAVLLVLTVQARAGGGTSGGYSSENYSGMYTGYHGHYYYGHGNNHVSPFARNIVVLVTLAFTALFFFGFALLLRRSQLTARKKLKKAQAFDRFWNETSMAAHVKAVFPRVQAAWMSRELRDIADVVTPRFIARFQPLLNDYKRRKMVNVVDNISIQEVRIVDVHDDSDNNKDRFAAYIKGEMRDYFMHESQGLAGAIGHGTTHGFEDIYVFIRQNDTWLLHNIVNDPESKDFKLKNHR